jgi:hypothetical protein
MTDAVWLFRLGCWPLLLELTNPRVREEQKARPNDPARGVDRVVALLEKRAVLGFDRRNSADRNAAVASSVDALNGAEELAESRGERVIELAVFPENTPIPLRALSDLWCAWTR